MADVRLRPATATDAPRLTAVARAAYGHYAQRLGAQPRPLTDDYATVVARDDITVAVRDGEVAGFVVLVLTVEGFTVDNVAVDPAHQGLGVGRALLEHAEAQARRAGHRVIRLYTHERMTESLALYTRIGYVEYDRRPLGRGDGALVDLRKRLA